MSKRSRLGSLSRQPGTGSHKVTQCLQSLGLFYEEMLTCSCSECSYCYREMVLPSHASSTAEFPQRKQKENIKYCFSYAVRGYFVTESWQLPFCPGHKSGEDFGE